jgi:RNA polymerase sigma factor (sigma-70 family)
VVDRLPESAVKLANRYARVYGSDLHDDLLSEACLAYARIKRPAPEGIADEKWEYVCISRDLIDWLRSQRLVAHCGIPKKKADLEIKPEIISAPGDTSGIFPMHLLAGLDHDSRLLCVWLWEGYRQKEIAEGYGVSESRMSQMLSSVRAQILEAA